MQEVVRKDHESFENLFRRFNRRVQQSGKLSQARKGQYFEKPISKSRKRVEAIRKSKIRALKKDRYVGKK
ncbi:30S ribosomal protein S21 [bacterium CG_4_10_14_0_2_um_filter_33_32]|nr:MAG: 30S ribosomal protein S21 [bacterium CG2_30_33_46]PIR67578.1 MAG: 30S ribosomal protein S21 [bacterium CG10_big_fil_rev_8_21_14_0_10_33_18]PIU76452.1 MAG: 30S ribosomal protein S21 [bacterium CG06_land_8_20_14_3_00_33_50]PIW81152.1 MAG: 30S ribosomal protein S21 [bacterium CG_4_8_14_3_um_filter_33_28]PIY84890.1 MAG: 30S ribosomal protein S21 [bacterium CG_4_10_14_0_8_um_filter_33_57]PIZ86509.1 MAG: 30S ribosomal protein S21 [bacterium CG_4_10_14_0_2_um_filter_33_32]PJA71774.1 MAG: 30S